MLRNVKEAVFAAAYSFLPYLQNFIQQRKLMSDYLGEEGVKNIKKKSQEHPSIKEPLLKEEQFQKLKLNKFREIYGNFAG